MGKQGTVRPGSVIRIPGSSKQGGCHSYRAIANQSSGEQLLANPRIGEKLFEFEPREVRRILVGQYEMRYEIQNETIYVLRLWHTREER